MDIESMMAKLHGKATKENYAALVELERCSEQSNVLYPYIGMFLEMIDSAKYEIRVRGFRLLCKQAR